MRRASFLVFYLALATPQWADAGTLDAKVAQICDFPDTGYGYVSRPKLVSVLLVSHGITLGDLEPELAEDATSVTLDVPTNAILGGSDYCQNNPCNPATKKATNAGLNLALAEVTELVDRNLAKNRDKESPFLVVGRNGEEIAAAADPATDLLVRGSIRIRCDRPKTAPGQPAGGTVDKPGDGGKAKGTLVVRAKPEDLVTSRTSEADFKKLSRATVSFNDDFAKEEEAFGIQGVVGYTFGRQPLFSSPVYDRNDPEDPYANTFWQLALYTSYTNQRVSSDDPAKKKSVHNLGFGVSGDVEFLAGFHHNIQIAPFYVHSFRSDADVLSATVLYTPQPSWPGIGALYVLGDAVYLQLKPQAKLMIGGILDSGNDTALASADDFSRIGPRLDLTIGAWEGTSLDGLAFNLAYDYLFVTSGPRNVVHRLETSLDYTLPKIELLALQLKFTDGQDLNTLEKQRLLSLGLGFKY